MAAEAGERASRLAGEQGSTKREPNGATRGSAELAANLADGGRRLVLV